MVVLIKCLFPLTLNILWEENKNPPKETLINQSKDVSLKGHPVFFMWNILKTILSLFTKIKMLRKGQTQMQLLTCEDMSPTNPKYILFLCVISGIAMTDGLKTNRRWQKPSKSRLPQVWVEYIHKTMQIVLEKIFSYDPLDYVSGVLLTKVKISKKFMVYARDISQNTQYASEVLKASGRIKLQMNESIMNNYVLGFHPFSSYTWLFHTHKRLSLNISIENIQFASDYLDCHWGRLKIYSSKSLDSTFTYCGHQTSFNIYPYYSDVNITISSYRHSIFIFSASHTIITKNQIVSISTSNLKISWINLVENDILLYTFYITVRKIYNIIVQFTETLFHKYDLFDGPGFLSTNLKSSGHMYETSTFQCTIQILAQLLQFTVNEFFNYTSKGIDISHILKLSSNNSGVNITFPMNTSFQQHCAIYLFTEEALHINITLLKIIYKGPTGERCKYGGLVTAEEILNDYKESLTVCESHIGAEHNSLTFFSKKSSLILFFYWYKQYSKIHTTAAVSLTKCTAVHLDACLVQKFCHSIHSSKSNLAKCNSFMKDISNSHLRHPSSKHLSYEKDDIYPDASNFDTFVFFLLNDEDCIVIQFRKRMANLGDLSYSQCKIQLRSNNALRKGKELQYKLKGSLYSFSHDFKEIKVKPKFFGDYLAFYGITEDFCFQISTKQSSNFNCKVPRKQKSEATICKGEYFLKMSQIFFEKKDVYIFASQSFSATSDLFRIKVQLNLFSNSWIDVIISEHNIIKNVAVDLKESVSVPFVLYHLKNIGYHLNHFFLLKFDENKRSLETLNFSVKLKSCFRGPQNSGKLRWSSRFNFTHLKDFKLISLPGRICKAKLEMGNMFVYGKEHLENSSLHLIWLHERFEFSPLSVDTIENCSKVSVGKNDQLLPMWISRCVYNSSSPAYLRLANCFSSVMKHYIFNRFSLKCFDYKFRWRNKDDLHYIIISNTPDSIDNKISPYKLSWMEASKLCKDAGGLLPYFRSKQDLDQLILFVKLSRHGSLLEGLFIGLVYSPNINKVKYFQL